MNENDVVDWLYQELAGECECNRGMGEIENRVQQRTLEIHRRVTERLTQDIADTEEFGCTYCGGPLNVVNHHRERTVNTQFGEVLFTRSYGWCNHCKKYMYPADATLGLHVQARSSPRLQEICALSVLRAPAGKAEDDVRRLTGVKLGATTLHREARRQGERALAIRDRDVKLSEQPHGVAALAARAPKSPPNNTLIIQIDAWNIRERDHWGETEAMRKAGEDLGRWHWVYTATIYRLDKNGRTQSDRPFIIDRGYVATRMGLEAFKQQLYAEALQRGLLQAETVLILGDGAVWIWNLANEHFKQAQQRVDLFHVKQHLWALAGELHPGRSAEAREWVTPFLGCLEKPDGAIEVIKGLEQLQQLLVEIDQQKHDAVSQQLGYFKRHQNRMDYAEGKKLGQPCGSGAIESTCSQYQRRFKLTGQFWSLEGDEAFLALDTLHRNQRWSRLFPHDVSLPLQN